MSKSGKGYLIGAGPGDPQLLTLRAADALRESSIVLVDELVDPAVLVHAPRARVIRVGKRGGRASVPQERTTRLLVDLVARGAIVARLKGGDPFVFGRGGEEALALARAGLAFEIVPGVTAAVGAAAYAGIPLTHRGVAASVAFVTGQREGGRLPFDASADTLVVYMCQRTIGPIARALLDGGRDAATPAAIIRGASWANQEVYAGQLAELADLDDDWHRWLDAEAPTLAIIGDVVSFAAQLSWTGRTPWPLAVLTRPLRRMAIGGA